MAQESGLGRGLSSLIPQKKSLSSSGHSGEASRERARKDYTEENTAQKNEKLAETAKEFSRGTMDDAKRVLEVPIDDVVPNPQQPRVYFDPEKLAELAQSISTHGIIQPLIVHKAGEHYELVAGERRLQASKKAGLKTVPVIVRVAVQEREKLELALIENIQRHDLNVVEEARAYNSLSKSFGFSQEEIAQSVGKSRSAVANRMRLLQLPIEIQRALAEGVITEGHAKAILALANPEKQRALFMIIVEQRLTVRQAEDRTQSITVGAHKRTLRKDPGVQAAEDHLIGVLGTKVKVTRHGDGGKVIIEYYSKEDLNALLEKIRPEV